MRVAVCLLLAAAFALSVAAFDTPKPVHAEVDNTVAIGCEFLFLGPAPVNGCDGVTAAEVATLAATIGDEDGTLEASDLDEFDLDANQIRDGGDAPYDQILIFAFVDNDGVVTFDAEAGVTVAISDDGGVDDPSKPDDGNAETCEGDDDLDCGTTILADGDGVVVATVSDGTADPGDSVDVDMFQADDTNQVTTEELNVVGFPDDIQIVAFEQYIQTSDDVDDCIAEADVTDSDQLGDPEKTFVAATVTDNDNVELTRIVVDFATDDPEIAQIGDDTPVTVDAGDVGVAAFAVVCAGEATGTSAVIASFDEGGFTEDASVEIAIVGEPASIALTASPAGVVCDGINASTVTATVRDADGNFVADGINVNFSIVALGAASPINVGTVDGVASSQITPLAGTIFGVTVVVTSGDAEASILIDCIPGVATGIHLSAQPPNPRCDGVATSLITAEVRDLHGELVGDGTPVRFDVFAFGVVDPALALTQDGIATTTFRGISQTTVGVPIFASSGSLGESLLIACLGFDTDGDGMPNSYEDAHGCLNANAPDALADADADALTNLSEYFIGTDPCVRDTDGDGCGDGIELQSNPSDGGDRNPLDVWDFYDVTLDRDVDLADTLVILQRFGLEPGVPGYLAWFDRYAPDPQKPYRTAAATGGHVGIDLADALVNLQSFGHSCTGG